ncbi:uncharacterized protein LOC112459052, partial [Temnothorax curvispinosus]|uniref:Uncharacterized protein LOC112459052 n=1 Tax=Temnothorax curvispinosus TaxID=300111 RepID=A0A6J1Q907_9HYME
MEEKVIKWLEEEDLADLTQMFISQKINSMKRLLALNEELIKELIPQIGLRAGFLSSWKNLVADVCNIQGEISKKTDTQLTTENIPVLDILIPQEISQDIPQEIQDQAIPRSILPEESTVDLFTEHKDSERISPSLPSVSNFTSAVQGNKRKRTEESSQPQCSRHFRSFKACEELTVLDFEELLKNYSLK